MTERLAHLRAGVERSRPAPNRNRLTAWLKDERGSLNEDERGFLGEEERGPLGEEVIPRFPLVRQGYDSAAVDAYVAELERDIAELDRELVGLRAQLASPDEVETEIKRIGEQTSSLLIAAHERHEEIIRSGQEEADRCVADARARASKIIAEAEASVRDAEAGVRELEARCQATHRERYRLLDEVRDISVELAALADARQEQLPAQVGGG